MREDFARTRFQLRNYFKSTGATILNAEKDRCSLREVGGLAMLDQFEFYPGFRVDASGPGASDGEIQLLLNFSHIPVPSEYLDLIRKMTEVEIFIQPGKYVRIWGPTGCVEMNSAYRIQDYISNSLAVGDDECDSVLILMNGGRGFGLYRVGFGALSAEDAEFIAPSIDSFLVDGTGAEVI